MMDSMGIGRKAILGTRRFGGRRDVRGRKKKEFTGRMTGTGRPYQYVTHAIKLSLLTTVSRRKVHKGLRDCCSYIFHWASIIIK
jgi:hypothetical protein